MSAWDRLVWYVYTLVVVYSVASFSSVTHSSAKEWWSYGPVNTGEKIVWSFDPINCF